LPTGTIEEAKIAGPRLYSPLQMSRATATEPAPAASASRPVGSSGRRPEPPAVETA